MQRMSDICPVFSVGNWTGVLLLSDPTTTSSDDDNDDDNGYINETYQTRSKKEPGAQILRSAPVTLMIPILKYACQRTSDSNLVFFTKRTGLPVDLLAQEMYFLFQRISDTRGLITVALADSSNP